MQVIVDKSQIDLAQKPEPQMHLWTISDYHWMNETEILDDGDRKYKKYRTTIDCEAYHRTDVN